MASIQARVARLLARTFTRGPIARAAGGPEFVPRYRATLRSMRLSFGRFPAGTSGRTIDGSAAGVRGEFVTPDAHPDTMRAVLYCHGGGYVACAPDHYRSLTGALAKRCDARVLAIDYRLAPEHPFPAALDDAIAGFDWLVSQGFSPSNIVAGGDSAGGGLALSLVLALRARGGDNVAGAFLLSPWVDLTSSGESVTTMADLDDVVVGDSRYFARLYVAEGPLDHPVASGLHADLHGLPPLLIQASRIEMLRDDAVRLAEKARASGVDAHLHLYDGVHHVWQLFTSMPESREALAEIAEFTKRVTRTSDGVVRRD